MTEETKQKIKEIAVGMAEQLSVLVIADQIQSLAWKYNEEYSEQVETHLRIYAEALIKKLQ